MPSATVDQARSLLEQRRRELQDELRQIETALSGLTGRRRGPGRPRGSVTRTRRRRRGGTRGEQAAKHVKSNPGITPSEIAKKMGIKPNYLYRVMADLQKEGRVRKRGRGYHPA
jgi:sugar-specific transcriptional regulator TrmB